MTIQSLNKPNTFNDLGKELSHSFVQNLALRPDLAKSYHLDIKRDDLIHPVISGNKWRKLKHLLQHIECKGYRHIATMGGRYSNFLHALTYACHLLGWKCELFVRGYLQQPLTPTLKDCESWGAKLNFVDRKEFQLLRSIPPKLTNDTYWIPEGGLQLESTLGVADLIEELAEPYNYVIIASATGTSVAGLVKGCDQLNTGFAGTRPEVIGISVLNNKTQQIADIKKLIGRAKTPWQVKAGYEFGGFAKQSALVDDFCHWFERQYQVAIEPIYTGRSFYAVFDLMKKKYFKEGSRILLIHCGGLQGSRKLE